MRTILGVILFIALIAAPVVFVFKEAIEDYGLKEFLIRLGSILAGAVLFIGLLLLSVWLIMG